MSKQVIWFAALTALTLVRPSSAASVRVDDYARRAYLRGEADAMIPFWVRTGGDEPAVSNAELVVRQYADNDLVSRSVVPIAELPPKSAKKVMAPVETQLRPGRTVLSLALYAKDGKRLAEYAGMVDLEICRRPGDHMDVRLWCGHTYYDAFAELGFTSACGDKFMQKTGFVTDLKPTRDERLKAIAEFDKVLASGMTYGIFQPFMYPPDKDRKQFWRRDRKGGTGPRDPQPEVSNPELQAQARRTADFFARFFGSHPAFKNVLFCSEWRDKSFPSFNTEHLRFKAEKGFDVPERTGPSLDWAKKRFAATKGIVPEDDKSYIYEKWCLAGGDGWPAFLSAAYDMYHRMIKDPEFDTFWDPAVRFAPAWTSGGSCRTLGQWVYADPEPMAIAGPTEELIAMSRGRQPAQQVMPMTQLICYRRKVAPVKETVAKAPAWFETHPDAAFLTIPPDALQEATWSMVAKPVDKIAYYGHETLIETGTDWYACTAPEARGMMKRLSDGLLRPLGPMLKRLGRKPPKVAVLESATSVMFGGHHEFGWQSSAVMQAQRARLDPRVIYEEEVVRDGLDGIDVIYAPHFVFTTQRVKDKIDAFRKRGGILVLDNDHMGALEPDVEAPGIVWKVPKIDQPEGIEELAAAESGNVEARLTTLRRKKMALENAELLRTGLEKRGYRSEVGSSSPEIPVYARQHGDIPYVFAVNDKRAFGDYVGQWGYMMEVGQPFAGEVTVRDPGFKNLAVYELSRGRLVEFTRKGGLVRVPVKYETNDGRLFVFAEERIAKVELAAKVEEQGKALAVTMRVLGASGKPMKGLWPVEVSVMDAAGRKIDGLDYLCAEDGVAMAAVSLNLNDAKGAYTVVCRDRASGLAKTVKVGK